jgi:AcrR family transcriptional regulator
MATPHQPSRAGRFAEAERNDARIIEAARELFSLYGIDASMAQVAEGAGVGIGSLYRRYPSKEDLLRTLSIDGMQRMRRELEAALALDDSWQGLTQYMEICVDAGLGSLLNVAGRFPITAEMIELAERGQSLLPTLLERAKAAGRLRPEITATDIILVFRLLRPQLSDDPALAKQLRRRYLALILDGMKTGDSDDLPGPSLGWEEISERWGKATG